MVSIIIPAYNASKYIAETMDSVLQQTYKDWELIIIDDGSKDNTKEIVLKYKEQHPQIYYYYQENGGVSVARNHGLEKAKGQYIALLDADDVWLAHNLEIKIKSLERNEHIKWVYSNMFNADEQMNITGEATKGKDDNILDSILAWKGEVVPGPCSNVVFDKLCYDEGVKFDPTLSTAADQDFTIQLAAKYLGKHINENLWKYRILGNSMSRNIEVMEKDHIRVFKKAAKLNLFKSTSFKHSCFSNLYWILAGSWWKNGNNKMRGCYFILLAILNNPVSISRLFKSSGQ